MISSFPVTPPQPFPSHLLPRPCPYEGAPPPTHPLPPHHSSIPLRWGIKPLQDQGPLLPLMPHKASSATYAAGATGSLHVYSLVGGLVPGSSRWSSYLMLFFLWVATPFSSFSPFPSSSIGVQFLLLLKMCDWR